MKSVKIQSAKRAKIQIIYQKSPVLSSIFIEVPMPEDPNDFTLKRANSLHSQTSQIQEKGIPIIHNLIMNNG